MAVSLARGASNGGCGVTPISITPPYSSSANAITITASSGQSYTYNFSQVAGPNSAVYYNRLADTTVRLGNVSGSSILQLPQSVAVESAAHEVRRMALGRSSTYVSDRLAVNYHRAALRSGNRSARDVESFEGFARARDLGPGDADTQTRVVAVPGSMNLSAAAQALRAHPEVASVNFIQQRFATASTPVFPNDSHFKTTEQWDMYQIGAPNAWGYTIGNANSPKLAIIDTGYDANHQDLIGKVVYAERDIKTVTSGVVVSLTAAQDTDGHGTNVSGVAGANTNNAFGFAGVSYNVPLEVFKIFPDGPGSGAGTDDEAQAIYDAVATGARVINLSIGSTQDLGPDPLERDAVAYAIARNVVVVAAAGNEGLGTMDFPGGYPGVVAVGATSLRDNNTGNPANATEYVASYSNYGPGLTIVAPGGDPNGSSDPDFLHWVYNLYTTTPFDPSQKCSNINDCKAFFAGTSQATPHVAGAAALLLARNPNLTATQVVQILISTADDIRDPHQGNGRLNLYRAMAAVAGDTAPVAPSTINFRAIAYTVSGGSNRPNILDVNYPLGVPPDANGNFRVADMRSTGQAYRIGLWYDANGNGIVDAGDYFGAGPTCNTSSACGVSSINVAPVPLGFVLQ